MGESMMTRIETVKKDLMAGGSSATLQELNSLCGTGDETFFYAKIITNHNHPSARSVTAADVYLSEDEWSLIWYLLESARRELSDDWNLDVEGFVAMPDLREHVKHKEVISILDKMNAPENG
jgi:hypothetical protein